MPSSPDPAAAAPAVTLSAVVGEADADPERVDSLARYLLTELRELDDVDVALTREGEAPPGSKVVDPITIGGLLITLLSSQALPHVIELIRGWLGRGAERETRAVKLELDGDSLELTAATAEEQERLVELFVARHTDNRA